MRYSTKLLFLFFSFFTLVVEGQEYEAPEILSPEDGWEISNFALSFRFIPPISSEFREEMNKNIVFSSSPSGNALPAEFKDQHPVYRLQIANDSAFTDFVFNEPIYLWATQHGSAQYMPREVFPAGTYYWRLRAEITEGINTGKLGIWSSFRKITLLEESPASSFRYEISNKNPLMVVTDIAKEGYYETTSELLANMNKDGFANDCYPQLYRKHVAAVIDARYKGPTRFEDDTTKLSDYIVYNDRVLAAGYKTMIFHCFSLAEQDWFYRHYPNMIATFTGETEDLNFFEYYSNDGLNEWNEIYYKRNVQLAKQHGGYFMNSVAFNSNTKMAIINEPYFYEQKEIDFQRAYGDHIIGGTKVTNTAAMHYQNSNWYGLWLSGAIGNRVFWQEHYFSRVANSYNPIAFPLHPNGFYQTITPMALQIEVFAHAAAMGTTVFTTRDNFETTNGAKTKWVAKDWLAPFFMSLIDNELIPSKQEAQKFNPVAIEYLKNSEYLLAKDNIEFLYYRDCYNLYDYAFDLNAYPNSEKVHTDMIPDDGGRYKMLPTVSPLFGTDPSWDVQVKKVKDFQSKDDFSKLFDVLYEPQSKGSAWVHIFGADNNTYILNSSEIRDIKQDYDIEYNKNEKFIERVFGEIEINTYILAKVTNNGERLWLTGNTHRYDQLAAEKSFFHVEWQNRPVTVNVKTKGTPLLTVTPSEALLSQSWDSNSQVLTFQIQHNETVDGLVEVVVEPEIGTSIAGGSIMKSSSIKWESDQIIIDTGVKKQTQWKVYSISGQLIMQGSSNIIKLELFSPGLYILNVDDRMREKFMVSK